MSKDQMFAELDLLRTDQPSQLSQLFFHAVFSRAASLTSGEDFVQQLQDTPEEKTWSSISGTLLSSAFIARDDYLDSPHISTLLALVIMANHFEHNKLAKNLRKAWMLIGDAGRLAIDMGLHRSSRLLLHSNGEDDVYTQMCIRTFWAVCVSERTMSITYGRPSMFDDKDIDVPPPKSLPSDDEHTKDWVESLRQLVIMSNIACRIMRFNYAAQTQFSGPLRVNAAASTIDCWMCSESDSDLEDRLHHGLETTTMDTRRKRLDDLEALYFFSNLIQLHKPFMHQDGTNKGEAGRPSFVVCHLAAIAISYITHTTPIAELADICKSPPTLYAIVKALQVHLENGSRQGESDRTIAFSEISFERTLSQLRKLPAIVRHPDDSSMLTETLDYMEQKYYQRTNTVVAGYLVSRHSHVDSPVPTLCSSNETSTVTSVSSVDGILHNNNHVSPHSSSLLPSTTVITQHQLLQQGSDWSSSTTVPTPSATSNNLTFVNVDPAIKGSSLGKRRLRETNISRKLPPSNLTPHSHKFRSNQHQKTEPLLTSPSSTINSIMGTSHYHYHHHHQEEHNHHVQQQLSTSQPVPINPFYDFMSMDNNNIMYQQGQQQQQPTKQQPPIISPLTNDTNNINNNNNNNIITTTTITSTSLDTHPSLYPETQIIPQRLEQDPDLPSAILNEELWSTTNNGYC
ncbi:hypothetical protein BDC45DRAFT_508486 [Circinella umbellata]|nr:hypothetical protein BDC45DRAFT_508486 [Circinella umbellata]